MEIKGSDFYEKTDEPLEIVQIGYAALEATKLTIEKKRAELKAHFSDRFINETEQFIKNNVIYFNKIVDDLSGFGMSGFKIDDADARMICPISELSDSGIFGGIWELAEKYHIGGLEINLHDILIRQETIEILELFDANPYTYPSAGTYIACLPNGHKYVRHMRESGYPAAVIGILNSSNDRIVKNGDETRFLTPIDRLYKDEQDFNRNGVSLRKELK